VYDIPGPAPLKQATGMPAASPSPQQAPSSAIHACAGVLGMLGAAAAVLAAAAALMLWGCIRRNEQSCAARRFCFSLLILCESMH
jgi:hypothetical protein